MLDLYNRKIDYLRISLTDNCNFVCQYCNPHGDVTCFPTHMSKDEVIKIVELFAGFGIKKVRLTGGEPLLRKDLTEIIKGIKNIKGIEEITMTTNGLLLAPKLEELKKAGLNRVNLSLDTFKKDKFKEITKVDGMEKVREAIKKLEELEMFPIKINCVVINNFNIDEISDFIELTKDKDIQVRFIELMGIGDNVGWTKDKSYSLEKILESHKELKLYKEENVAKIYKVKNYKGEVGMISPNSNKFCSACNRVRVTSEGKLKLCLHSNKEEDLLEIIKSKNPRLELSKVIKTKPKEHKLEDNKFIEKNMVKIGG